MLADVGVEPIGVDETSSAKVDARGLCLEKLYAEAVPRDEHEEYQPVALELQLADDLARCDTPIEVGASRSAHLFGLMLDGRAHSFTESPRA